MRTLILAGLLSALVALSGCKSDAEKRQTESRIDLGRSAIVKIIDADRSDAVPKATALAQACEHLTRLQASRRPPVCDTKPWTSLAEAMAPLEQQRSSAALDTYAPPAIREALVAATTGEVETTRRQLLSSVILAHWAMAQPLADAVGALDASVAAATNGLGAKHPGSVALRLLPAAKRDILGRKLTDRQAVLQSLVQGDDAVVGATLGDIAAWRDRLQQAGITDAARAELTAAVIEDVDNALWQNTAPQRSEGPDLAAVRTLAVSPPAPSALLAFVSAAGEFDTIGTRLQFDETALPPALDDAADAQLARECSTLLAFDEATFDEVCGDGLVLDALHFALNRLSGGVQSGSSATGPDATSPVGAVPASGGIGELKERLGVLAADGLGIAGAAPTAVDMDADLRRIVVRDLTVRIRESARLYGQASVQGSVVEMVVLEAKLDYFHRRIAVAAAGELPPSLSHPLALLSPAEVAEATQEMVRIDRVLSNLRVYASGDPALEVTQTYVRERLAQLRTVAANPASKADIASVLLKADPEQLKAALVEADVRFRAEPEAKLNLAREQFKALPAVFEVWRGPRGPPANDNFPRSIRIYDAFSQVGRNPQAFIEHFAALQAEHREFYRALAEVGGEVEKAWRFGADRPMAWMMAQLNGAELATLSILKVTRPGAMVVAASPEWRSLIGIVEEVGATARAELGARVGKLPPEPGITVSGHPPGYPPERPPSLSAAAERYTRADGRPTAIERQIRVAITRSMYENPALTPTSIKAQVADSFNGQFDTEQNRLRQIIGRVAAGGDRLDNLNRHAALATERLSNIELVALTEAKKSAADALQTLQERVAAVERSGWVQPDPARWTELRRMSLYLGKRPPPADPAAIVVPGAPKDGGPSGAAVAFRSIEVDRAFEAAEQALARAEAQLALSEVILKRPMAAAAVGSESGRAVAGRTAWRDGAFDFAAELAPAKRIDTPRYPEGLRDWHGFFDEPPLGSKKPFSFSAAVQEFTNFRGVGGGIHFGTTAEFDATTSQMLGDGALLTYDAASRRLLLRTMSGGDFSFGPVEPRVLKALYSYVTSYPGINLAITIGATGGGNFSRDRQTPVLIDPSFVDNPVGQALYLADTIPWRLDNERLANGAENPAQADFAVAKSRFDDSIRARTAQVASLVRGVKPASEMTESEWVSLLPASMRDRMLVLAVASSATPAAFAERYRRELEREYVAEIKQSDDMTKALRSVKKQAGDFRRSMISADTVREAVRLLQNDLVTSAMRLLPNFQQLDPSTPPRLGDVFPNTDGGRLARRLGSLPLEQLTVLEAIADTLDGNAAAAENRIVDVLLPPAKRTKAIDETIGRLQKQFAGHPSVAHTLLWIARGLADHDNSAIRVTQPTLQIAAAALMDIINSRSLEDIAAALPTLFGTTSGLAVLFDQSTKARLENERIVLDVDLRYRYAMADYEVVGTSLVYHRDSTDAARPIKAKSVEELSAAANDHLGALTAVFPPLASVHQYAGLAALLRWAACSPTQQQALQSGTDKRQSGVCFPREGIIVDLSALGAYDLRDRTATPTPDAEERY